MSPIDPRLAPVLASERKTGRGIAVFGLVLLGIGAIMFRMGLVHEQASKQMISVIMGLVFTLPGLWMMWIWLRGPEATTIVRLLTEGRARIKAWDIEYVSIQHGPTQTRIKLFLSDSRYTDVTLAPADAKLVIAYVAETAPRKES